MEISQIVEQVTAHVQDAPEKIKDVIADPKGTIEEITGQNLDDVDLGEIVDKVKGGLGEEGIVENIGENLGGVADAAKDMLEGLFGGSKE